MKISLKRLHWGIIWGIPIWACRRALNRGSVRPDFSIIFKASVWVEYLEKEGRGLNLTLEVLDGIKNHKTSGRPCTLEGQIVMTF